MPLGLPSVLLSSAIHITSCYQGDVTGTDYHDFFPEDNGFFFSWNIMGIQGEDAGFLRGAISGPKNRAFLYQIHTLQSVGIVAAM